MTTSELFEAVRWHYGKAHQIIKCIEEMSELTKELCKLLGGARGTWSIAEEMGDVEITFAELKQYYNLGKAVEESKKVKLQRLEKRLEAEGVEFQDNELIYDDEVMGRLK